MLTNSGLRIGSTLPEALRCLRCPSWTSSTRTWVLRRTSRSLSSVSEEAGRGNWSKRGYATEANVIPKAVLIRSPPPPAPTTQGQPPESATSLQPPLTRLDHLDGLLHHFHESVFASEGSCARIPDLYDQLSSNAAKVLDHELAFEDTPREDRQVSTANLSAKEDKEKLSWLESCKLAEAKLSSEQPSRTICEDGLVLVAHVVDAKPLPIMSWSMGFVISTKEEHQYVVSCSHTLESVRICYIHPRLATIL